MAILYNPMELTQERVKQAETPKSETLLQKTDKLFATHIQNEFESFVAHRWNGLIEGFEQEFSPGFTDQRKEELANGLEVKFSVSGVAAGYMDAFPS